MDDSPARVFLPSTVAEFHATAARFPDARVFAGGTDILRRQADARIELPPNVIYIRNIEEIRQAARTERYLEFGAAMTLTETIELGEKVVPPVLFAALNGIAVPGIRNLATVGGNLLCPGRRFDLFAPMSVLDARIEIRGNSTLRWLPLNRLIGLDGIPELAVGEIVAHVRIPSETFDLNLYRKIGSRHYPDADTGVFCCCAKTSRGMLTDFRLAFAGERFIRDRDIENSITGKGLPFSERDVESVIDAYREELDEELLGNPLRQRLINLVSWALSYLTERISA
jgi:CO/xanthine dehydrogenase FAD-binding subunit